MGDCSMTPCPHMSSIATRIVIPDGMMANSLIPDGMMANSLIRRGPGAVARRFAHGRLLDDPMSTYEFDSDTNSDPRRDDGKLPDPRRHDGKLPDPPWS